MIASEARAAASRANSLKSTGPKSDEGKGRSRANSYKHGMTGTGVVLPPHDAAEVGRRAIAFASELDARGEVQTILAHRAALLSVQLEKCAAAEAEATAARVRNAEEEFDEDRQLEADRLMAELAIDPAPGLRNLKRMPEGVDRLVAAWGELRWDLSRPKPVHWDEARHHRVSALCGRAVGAFGSTRAEAISRAIRDDTSHLEPGEVDGLDFDGRRRWGRETLIAWIDAEVAALIAHRAGLNHASIAADRAGAPVRSLVATSEHASRARRYEVSAGHAFHRALRDLKALQEPEAARKVAPGPRAVPSASFSTPAPTTPSRADRSGQPILDLPLDLVPMAIGHPPGGLN